LCHVVALSGPVFARGKILGRNGSLNPAAGLRSRGLSTDSPLSRARVCLVIGTFGTHIECMGREDLFDVSQELIGPPDFLDQELPLHAAVRDLRLGPG
jgi:hypothetical protein